MWFIYEILYIFGFIAYLPKALLRKRLPHPGWLMRLGRYPESVTKALAGRQRPIWVHAVSVGEVLAVLPLLRELSGAYPSVPLVISTVTPGGFDVASKQISGFTIPIYFPLDLRACVDRALTAIRPRALILVESELWPVMLRQAKAGGVPVAVVNGRVSPRSFTRSQRLRAWLFPLLQRVDLFLMQSEADAARLKTLGAPEDRVRAVGSLKWDAGLRARPAPQKVQEAMARLGLQPGEQVIVAGSTHRGEEQALLGAYHALRNGTRLRLILAPRHLERLEEVEGLVRQAGCSVQRLSAASSVGGRWDVGLVDTLGQLPVYYGLASVAFVGVSLIPHGGQNPIEPASLGKPVVFGPFMHNFAEIAGQLVDHQAAWQLPDPQQLVAALKELLGNPARAEPMGERARALTERSAGSAQRTLEALKPLLA